MDSFRFLLVASFFTLVYFTMFTGCHADTYVSVKNCSEGCVNENITLECNYFSNATIQNLTTLSWTKSGYLVIRNRFGSLKVDPFYEGRVGFIGGKGVASIWLVANHTNDTGTYKCLVSISNQNGGDKDQLIQFKSHHTDSAFCKKDDKCQEITPNYTMCKCDSSNSSIIVKGKSCGAPSHCNLVFTREGQVLSSKTTYNGSELTASIKVANCNSKISAKLECEYQGRCSSFKRSKTKLIFKEICSTDSLSAGAIAGIVIGVLVLCGIVAFFIVKCKTGVREDKSNESENHQYRNSNFNGQKQGIDKCDMVQNNTYMNGNYKSPPEVVIKQPNADGWSNIDKDPNRATML